MGKWNLVLDRHINQVNSHSPKLQDQPSPLPKIPIPYSKLSIIKLLGGKTFYTAKQQIKVMD